MFTLFPTNTRQVLVKVLSWQQAPGNLGRRVSLMPSVRDATAVPAFPQPPLALDGAVAALVAGGEAPGGGGRLRSLQSPCSFIAGGSGSGGSSSGGGLTVAASSQDVLLHLSAGEVSRGGQGQDRMSALASHVVGQQRWVMVSFPYRDVVVMHKGAAGISPRCRIRSQCTHNHS